MSDAAEAPRTFFTSDHHFGDGRRLGIDRRPFPDAAAMDAAMTARWNAAVRPKDVVWHLGDFARPRDPGAIEALLAGLHGTKHLLVGNNDGPATRASAGWASVSDYVETIVEGRALVLCHYAFRTWNGSGRGAVNLHGHSHGRLNRLPGQVDVGVDVWDFTPVTLATLIGRRRRRMESQA